MDKKTTRIFVTAVLLLAAYLVTKHVTMPLWAQLIVYLAPYLLISYDVIIEAWEDIASGHLLDEHFLMFIATVGALSIGFIPGAEEQFLEGVFVMLFFKVGELFEDYAEGKSRASIAELMDIRPDAACVERGGELLTVAPVEVAIGETLVVKPGEKVALDGVITQGTSSLNTVALTGESLPRDVAVGDEVVSGCINMSGLLRVEVRKSFGESTVQKILQLVEQAADHKSKSETFIHRFAVVYTPVVVTLALLVAVIPPFFCADYLQGLALWGYRALAFLVVSCPCALVLSVPLTFFAGIGCASRKGILIKGGNYMEALAGASTVVMDKTGTLTEGVFSVSSINPVGITKAKLLHYAAAAENYSTHPVAEALRRAHEGEIDKDEIGSVKELAGQGVSAIVAGKEVLAGNEKLMTSAKIGIDSRVQHYGTVIHVAIDGRYAGYIVITDRLKPDAACAIRLIKKMGVRHTVMLTGDNETTAASVANALGVDEYFAGLLPADKVAHVERLIEERRQSVRGKKSAGVVFVGDGINDAPVLARADAGIAMGGLGSDAAIEASDIVLMDDKPSKIATAIHVARHTITIARQNTYFAIIVKAAILVLVAAGLLGRFAMPMAVFGDVGVMVLAVLNATRALSTKSVA